MALNTALPRFNEVSRDPRCSRYEPVTPHDTNANLLYITKYIEIGGAGTLTVLDNTGTSRALGAYPAGHRFDIEATQVMSTGTSATAIVAFYG